MPFESVRNNKSLQLMDTRNESYIITFAFEEFAQTGGTFSFV